MSPVNFDIDAFDEAIQEAPKVGFGPRSTFGKLVLADVQIMSWKREPGAQKSSPNPRAWNGKEKPNKDKREYMQMFLEIDLGEFSERAKDEGWEWKRRVDVQHGSADGKSLTDFDVTFYPSIVEMLGKDWLKRLQKGVYVEVAEPETVELEYKGDRKGEKKGWIGDDGILRINTSVQIVRVFKNKSECEAARSEKYTARESFSENGDEEKTVSIPKKVIADVVGILNVYDGDTENEEFLELLKESPYSDYPLKVLIGEAQKAITK